MESEEKTKQPRTPRSRVRTLIEVSIWVALLLWAGPRLLPQLSAVTGFGGTVGDVPAFELETLDGEVFTAEDLKGNVVVLNFWATWCRPCRMEMPSLQKVFEDKAGEGLVVLGASTDLTGRASVERFLEERDIEYPVGIVDSQFERAFGGVPHIPTTFIIDRNGVIRHRVVGLFLGPAIRLAVNRLLEEE